MALTTAEVESLRYHLGWGNVSVAASPYTPDGFYEVFSQVVAPNLSTATETTATTAVTAGSTTAVTPGDMTDIVVGAQLIVDVGEAAEIVVVRSVTLTTFSAAFANAHPSSGYPVMLMSGKARLRYLLAVADRLWTRMQSSTVTGTFGIKQLGQGEIEWFAPSSVYQGVVNQYVGTVHQLSMLVRVPVNPETRARPSADRLEAY